MVHVARGFGRFPSVLTRRTPISVCATRQTTFHLLSSRSSNQSRQFEVRKVFGFKVGFSRLFSAPNRAMSGQPEAKSFTEGNQDESESTCITENSKSVSEMVESTPNQDQTDSCIQASAGSTEEASASNAKVEAEDNAPKLSYSRGRPRKRKNKHQNLHMTFKKARLTSDETIGQTKYYFENGLRKVVPYDHKYNTFCKGRWVGKTLGELYTSEFRLYPIEYYDKAIREGRLLLNLEPATSLGQIVKDNDLLTSVVHRHECPISDVKVEVIVDNDEFFVVNKPCSIPIHPVGRFRHNCLVSILAREFDRKEIFGIHRIDRMTSGLCIFTKTREIAKKCHQQIKERQVEKEYLCRVVGDFTKFKLPTENGHKIAIEGDEVTVSEPMKVYDMKIGTTIVSHDEESKDAETLFKCLSTNGKTSVISCRPKTGRTHQIRVHLQYIGYPIVNDPMYNHPAWGDERFTLGPITKPLDGVTQGLIDMKKWSAIVDSVNKGEIQNANTDVEPPEMSPALQEAVSTMKDIVPYRPDCEECKHPLSDPKPEELIMFLHALRYKGQDWEFETPAPDWAASDWVEEYERT